MQSAANVALEATLEDGTRVIGETRISKSRKPIRGVRLRPRKVKPMADTLAAMAQADLIVLGPGSLFTSVIPNLLVEGISAAIRRSPALKAYFVNLMSQPGETDDFRASDHVAAVLRHAGRAYSRSLIDICVINTRAIGGKVVDRYGANDARPVENDIDHLERMGLRVIGMDLVRMSGARMQEKIRHDQGVLGAVVLELAQKGRRAKLKLTS